MLAWAPLAAGKLTGKYRRGETGRLDGVDDRDTRDHNEEETITAVLEIAEQGGWSPAQVALAWLRSRPGNIIPIVAATKESQLRDNLGAVDLTLDAESLDRLDRTSAVSLGFPHDFLRDPGIIENVYGDRWAGIEDRRSTYRRTASGIR